MEELRQIHVIRATKDLAQDNKIRVAAYCRVSSDSDDQVNSFMAQVRYYTDFINNNSDMRLVDVYADEGITGTSTLKRDEFNRMMKDSKNGKIDRVYVKSVSRFARNSLECIENIRLLKNYGTTVFFENDGIDTKTMNHELILYIKSAFAQAEALNCSKRVKRSNQMRMELGEFSFLTAPFGYRIENKTLVPVPEEAKVIEKIFNYYVKGMGVGTIVKTLNEDNELGGPWWPGSVRYILKNEKYIGDTLHQKTYTPDVIPMKKQRNRGQVDQYYVTNTHEGIISRELFALVKEKLNKNQEAYSLITNVKKHNFTRRLYCGDCGHTFKLLQKNNTRFWQCTKDGIAGQRCYTHPIKEEVIKRTFCRFYNRLRHYENEILKSTLYKLIELKKTITKSNSGISEIDTEMLKLNDKLQYCYKLIDSGTIDKESFLNRETEIKKRMTQLKTQRSKLISEDDDEMCIDELRSLIQYLEEKPKALIVFDYNIFLNVVEKIIVEEDKFVFKLKCGLSLSEVIAWN